MRHIFLDIVDATRYIYSSMTRIIKKYGNRKLYDTSQSKYVSLKHVKEVIRDGENVTIIERDTGKDITSEVLTKAILEDTEDKRDTITSGVLHNLIRWGSDTIDAGLSQVGKGLNKVLPIAGVQEISTLQSQIKELEKKVNQLQNRLKDNQEPKKEFESEQKKGK